MRHRRRFPRVRTATRGLGLTIVIWAFLALLSEWGGAAWPHRTINLLSCFDLDRLVLDAARCEYFSEGYQWKQFLTVGIVVEFLWIKSYMMGFMTRHWDNLGRSLIAANLAFSAIYLYAMAASLWPHIPYAADVREGLRYGLIAILAWGIVQLLLVPDQDDPAPHPDQRIATRMAVPPRADA